MAVFGLIWMISVTPMKVFFATLTVLSSCQISAVPIRRVVDSPDVVNLTHTEQLEVVKHLTESSFISKQFVYRAQQGYRVSIHIQSVNIHRTSAGAIDQGLDVFDGSSIRPENRLTEMTIHGIYPYPATVSADNSPSVMFKDYISSGTDILINIYAYLTPENQGFNITAVPFMLPDLGQCPEKHFLCKKNKRCIMKTCLCDGTADCGQGDMSDEDQCPGSDNVSHDLKIVVPLSAAVCIFGGIIIGGVAVLIWMCKKKKVMLENVSVVSTTFPTQETVHVTNAVYESGIGHNESEEQIHHLHQPDRDAEGLVEEDAASVEQRHDAQQIMLLSWSRNEGNSPPEPPTGLASSPPQYDCHPLSTTDGRSRAPPYESRDMYATFTPPGLPSYMSNAPSYK